MALSKIQSESINLADDFTFTGSVTGAGKILQVAQSVNKYRHSVAGATNTDYVIQSASGVDWNPSVSIAANSKVLVNIMLSTSTSSADPFQLFKLQRQIDSGSWVNVDVGEAGGSRHQSFAGYRIRAENAYGQLPINLSYLDDPAQASACTVKYRVVSRQGAGTTRISYFNWSTADAAESGTFVSTCIMTEIA